MPFCSFSPALCYPPSKGPAGMKEASKPHPSLVPPPSCCFLLGRPRDKPLRKLRSRPNFRSGRFKPAVAYRRTAAPWRPAASGLGHSSAISFPLCCTSSPPCRSTLAPQPRFPCAVPLRIQLCSGGPGRGTVKAVLTSVLWLVLKCPHQSFTDAGTDNTVTAWRSMQQVTPTARYLSHSPTGEYCLTPTSTVSDAYTKNSETHSYAHLVFKTITSIFCPDQRGSLG
ncbi:uncharacterized protein LOC119049123 [Artibeus jamaicensis]|uniref:uncharacterized protein LOC119049123 n=1 Tax=Artibeus jamaicensis TaxID=9417 RepID=UPI00235AD892|nr:uncharacterized protein LOC119049123 [Artibeus jamaicensis]